MELIIYSTDSGKNKIALSSSAVASKKRSLIGVKIGTEKAELDPAYDLEGLVMLYYELTDHFEDGGAAKKFSWQATEELVYTDSRFSEKDLTRLERKLRKAKLI